jgi:hypothetical protein
MFARETTSRPYRARYDTSYNAVSSPAKHLLNHNPAARCRFAARNVRRLIHTVVALASRRRPPSRVIAHHVVHVTLARRQTAD